MLLGLVFLFFATYAALQSFAVGSNLSVWETS